MDANNNLNTGGGAQAIPSYYVGGTCRVSLVVVVVRLGWCCGQ